jgi:hypothetical protein
VKVPSEENFCFSIGSAVKGCNCDVFYCIRTLSKYKLE